MRRYFDSQEIGVNFWRKMKGEYMKKFRCEHISAYNSMENWRKIGVKLNGQSEKARKIKGFWVGGEA